MAKPTLAKTTTAFNGQQPEAEAERDAAHSVAMPYGPDRHVTEAC
jgi:hypothetical protein